MIMIEYNRFDSQTEGTHIYIYDAKSPEGELWDQNTAQGKGSKVGIYYEPSSYTSTTEYPLRYINRGLYCIYSQPVCRI